jgi:hypothetical protein
MIETYMVVGAVTFAKYLVIGNVIVGANRKLLIGNKPSNKIVLHKKWSDIK